ncbi:MAG TPA: hypothetical protein VFQ53_16640 [Kofleriaceae bacterium]|nr:hypothetical protein [Kofleriaceae bacterium]
MKQLLVCWTLATVSLAAAPVALGDGTTAPAADRMWSRIVVQSVKPTLSARNIYVIKGVHNNGVRGGWTVETAYRIDDAAKVVQITVAAHAPAGSVATRNPEPIEAKVEIQELAGPAYSGKPGKYDVIVVDHDGKELARTVYEIKPKP